jgi:hypothetical protein
MIKHNLKKLIVTTIWKRSKYFKQSLSWMLSLLKKLRELVRIILAKTIDVAICSDSLSTRWKTMSTQTHKNRTAWQLLQRGNIQRLLLVLTRSIWVSLACLASVRPYVSLNFFRWRQCSAYIVWPCSVGDLDLGHGQQHHRRFPEGLRPQQGVDLMTTTSMENGVVWYVSWEILGYPTHASRFKTRDVQVNSEKYIILFMPELCLWVKRVKLWGGSSNLFSLIK